MSYTIVIENRVSIGFCLGFSSYSANDEYSYGEFILYLGLIAIRIRYESNE